MPQDLIQIKAVVEGEFNHINICEKSRERVSGSCQTR